MLEEEFLEAVAKGDTQRVVRLLGQTSAATAVTPSTTVAATDCPLPTKNGQNALHIAAQVGNSDIVSVLLLSGLYDCNTPDSAGYTALQIASAEGHLEIVKLLIKAGANVNSADKVHGNTALHEASWKGYSQTIAQLAVEKADLNIKNWGGFTALHLCCQKGHNQSCRELLLAGCDSNIQNNYGDTALHTSARYGHAGVMRILISAKCRISDQNKNGDTALHIAAAMSHRKLTRILLEANCNKSILNKQNETAEDIAIRKSLTEIVNILRNVVVSRTKLKSTENASRKIVDIPQPSVKVKSSKDKHSKKKDGKQDRKDKRVLPDTKEAAAVPWSPYGCHYYPDASDFPEPKLDTLPSDPLKKGEQYYLDLAGNIRKGPIGVGYTCYCAPFFKQLETNLDKKTKQLKKRINQAEENINQRLKTVEQNLDLRRSCIAATSAVALDNRRSFHAIGSYYNNNNNNNNNNENRKGGDNNESKSKDIRRFDNCRTSPVLRSRSLEYIFDNNHRYDRAKNERIDLTNRITVEDNCCSSSSGKMTKEKEKNSDKDDSIVSYKFGNRSLNETKPALVISSDDVKYGKYFGLNVITRQKNDSNNNNNNNILIDDFRVNHLPYCRDLNSNKCESMYSLSSIYNSRDADRNATDRNIVRSSDYVRSSKKSIRSITRTITPAAIDLWSNKRTENYASSNEEADDDDRNDDDCDPVTDGQCNDSGYSTKMCSNSQGPSPSLSGRTEHEHDGVLSNASSQDSKQLFDANIYPYRHHRHNHHQSISIGAASIV